MSMWLRARVVPLAISVRTSAAARASTGSATRWRSPRSMAMRSRTLRAFDMRQARRAPMRLVEMDVAFDESGQEQMPGKIDALARRRAARRVRRDDEAVGDLDVGERRPGQARVGEQHQRRPSRLRRDIFVERVAIELEFLAGGEAEAQIVLVVARDRLAENLRPIGQAHAPPFLELLLRSAGPGKPIFGTSAAIACQK